MKLKKLLLYGGADKDDYERIEGSIWRENRKNLIVFCYIQLLIMLLMCLAAYSSDSFNGTQKNFYWIGAVAIAAVLMLFIHLPKKKIPIALSLDLCFVVTFGMAIYNSLVVENGRPAVSFMVYLVFLPLIVSGRPISMILRNLITVAAFIYFNSIYCSGMVARTNIVNVIIFAILVMIFAIFTMKGNIERYINEDKLRYIGDIDLLTGVNNRNSYEQNIERYQQICKGELNCIYIDLNGLHELNNTKGHEAGDKAIQSVAEELKHNFRQSDIYRIGGDEFVIFAADAGTDGILARIAECSGSLAEKGVFISYGVQNMKKEELDMDALVTKAELQMYEAKNAYYREHGLTHR